MGNIEVFIGCATETPTAHKVSQRTFSGVHIGVIYLTPSSSPFKKDEREMLAELFRMGKPVILAITKSDTFKENTAEVSAPEAVREENVAPVQENKSQKSKKNRRKKKK